MAKEKNIQSRIMMALAQAGVKIFRNNTGLGWAGKVISRMRGNITVENARPLHAGLCVGSSDLIGWTSVVVTQEMVGEKVAVFTAVEVKNKSGRPSKEQLRFIYSVVNDGGIAGICRSESAAVDMIEDYTHN